MEKDLVVPQDQDHIHQEAEVHQDQIEEDTKRVEETKKEEVQAIQVNQDQLVVKDQEVEVKKGRVEADQSLIMRNLLQNLHQSQYRKKKSLRDLKRKKEVKVKVRLLKMVQILLYKMDNNKRTNNKMKINKIKQKIQKRSRSSLKQKNEK